MTMHQQTIKKADKLINNRQVELKNELAIQSDLRCCIMALSDIEKQNNRKLSKPYKN
jgi:hypothetical protein